MSYEMMLNAASALGIGMNVWQTIGARNLISQGAALDRQAIDLRMQQNTLASTEQALSNQNRLRQTLASQYAMYAGRGQLASPTASTRSINAFNADERARKMNLSFSNTQLFGQRAAIGIQASAQKAAVANQLLKSSLSNVSFNSLFGNDENKLNQSTGTL